MRDSKLKTVLLKAPSIVNQGKYTSTKQGKIAVTVLNILNQNGV